MRGLALLLLAGVPLQEAARTKKSQRDWAPPASPVTAMCSIPRAVACTPEHSPAAAGCLTAAEFTSQYLDQGPVILGGLTDTWAARAWTKKSFVKKYGKLEIRVAPADLIITAGPEYVVSPEPLSLV